MLVPSLILKQLYNVGSLRNTDEGVAFSIKNRLSDTHILEVNHLMINGKQIPHQQITFTAEDQTTTSPVQINAGLSLTFPLGTTYEILAQIPPIKEGKHDIELEINSDPFGVLCLKVEGNFTKDQDDKAKIPRNSKDDYSKEAIEARQAFLEAFTKQKINHLKQYSFDPHSTVGNCEHFIGVAQVPVGIAGPIQVNGEHADGEYLVPMATTEGTLIASYNRGIKVLNQSGGAICTVQDDAMQRAPAFVFENARIARDFVIWVQTHYKEIAKEAESTTTIGKLIHIDPYLATKFAYLRFNFHTGDAAGQNMVSKATFQACNWIIENYNEHPIQRFYLEGNLSTDKKPSMINTMHTRGKRVTAEITVPRNILQESMRVTPETLAYHGHVANIGTFLSGANSNALHPANGITAMFIATGQDVANVAEACAAILHTEVTPKGDFYASITIPSLIIATYGGGTGLATQRESLELMHCYGHDKVRKFAEIIAAVVLAGELSLGAAISSQDWVASHEQYGRNR